MSKKRGEETMRAWSKRIVVGVLTLLFVPVLWGSVLAETAGVCGQGLGIPPFLSAGTRPNLLLVLDNSGSMLDAAYTEAAYTDPSTDVMEIDPVTKLPKEKSVACVDNDFDAQMTADPNKVFAGLFDPKKWYKWVDGTIQWKSGTTYAVGDIVYSEGVFYEAVAKPAAGASTGARIIDDTAVTWKKVYDIPAWTSGVTYPAHSFVRVESQLYYTDAGGTAGGAAIEADTVLKWLAVNSTLLSAPAWAIGVVYPARSFVTSGTATFYTATGGTSSGTSLASDKIIWVPVTLTKTYAVGDYVTENGRLHKVTSVAGGKVTGKTWLEEGHFEETPYLTSAEAKAGLGAAAGAEYMQAHLYVKIISVGTAQSGVSVFAASGNLLNWASASKLDIQKKILTGGKYDKEIDLLVSEGRGCSSRNFIKEVKVNTTQKLTFAIRGSLEDDRLGTTDDTTRIMVMGVSAAGFIGSSRQQACQTAIDEVAKGADASLGTVKTNVDTCLAYSGNDPALAASNAAYNHSVFSCWSIVKKGFDDPTDLGNVSEIQNACETVYDAGVLPATIDPWDSGYMCSGVYNKNVTPTINRPGYVGQCWEPGSLPAGCQTVTCSAPYGVGNPRCFPDNLKYECFGNYNANQGTCNKPWTLVLTDKDPADGIACAASSTVATPAQWTNDTVSDPTQCIQDAMWEYCGALKIPEVIDPTDQLFNTGETWGMVGAMIDSGVVAMFGTDRPLIVMKGYVRPPEDPVESTVALKKYLAPEGIIHEVAGDLRLGAMAFNDNGAKTECDLDKASTSEGTIVKYCPGGILDGARVIMGIKEGDDPSLDKTEKHVNDLARAINSIRATAWTPLAEAMFNALGYYGQNTAFQINPADFPLSAADDPVQYWCQPNYVLVITEGASTADIHGMVKQKIIDLSSTVKDDTLAADQEGVCTNGLYGSTYLDDLTYFGQHAIDAGVYTKPKLPSDEGVEEDKQSITTYLVVSGTANDDGTSSECNPARLMKNAAANSGTTLLQGEDPAQLESNLRAALSDILFRTSAGSAASVISSSRSGEGGVYQAVFWPKIARGVGKDPLLWAGDVHALFLDKNGLLWDDYSGGAASAGPSNLNLRGALWSEDKNGDGLLQADEDTNGNGVLDGDRRVVTFYNESTRTTQICFNPSVIEDKECKASQYAGTTDVVVELRDFNHYIWSANQQLASISDSAASDEITRNREVLGDGRWNFSTNRRYIFTWNDLDNDGLVDQDLDRNGTVDVDSDSVEDRQEVLELVPGMNGPYDPADPYASTLVTNLPADPTAPRNGFLADFNVTTNQELDNLINWLRGKDALFETDANGNNILEASEDQNGNGKRDYVLRCRKQDCELPPDSPTANTTWRLGDVINSTPTLVTRPSEGYHLIYKDQDYARFYKRHMNRRHVLYFGGNDGMLHAVNAGFYLAGVNKFLPCGPAQRDPDTNTCTASAPYSTTAGQAYPALGDELWAYVPYNLQPHLRCLTNPEYDHKYFVDGTPRVFDVRIFPDDGDTGVHPGGWGTILVGSLRFGGAPTLADGTAPITDKREFVSTYFILDITDPERPPVLLAEMTMTTDLAPTAVDLNGDGEPDVDAAGTPVMVNDRKFAPMGYSTPMPSVVEMRNDDGNSEWFLVIGNGPTTLKGENNQQGRVGIVPLNALTGVNAVASTDGNYTYKATNRLPFRLPNVEPAAGTKHFGRKLIPVVSTDKVASFVGDMVSADMDVSAKMVNGLIPYKTDAVYFGTVDGTGFAPYAASTYKKYWDGDGRLFRLVTNPANAVDSFGNQAYTYPEAWEIRKLLDARGPISAAPNLGYDGSNSWVYFGTGRFFAPEDKTDAETKYFFGVKEPFGSGCTLNWGEVQWWSGTAAVSPTPSAAPGLRGLMRTDGIRVLESGKIGFDLSGDYLYCSDSTGCSGLSQLTALDPVDTGSTKTYYGFSELEQFIKGERCGLPENTSIGIDGWYRVFTDPRERSLGMPTLLGGLVTFTSYQPFADNCKAEGVSNLYGVYFLTGTAWYQSVFGTYPDEEKRSIVKDKLSLGLGLATTPSLQVGEGSDGAKAFIQTSTGEIIEIEQENLPIPNATSGRASWENK